MQQRCVAGGVLPVPAVKSDGRAAAGEAAWLQACPTEPWIKSTNPMSSAIPLKKKKVKKNEKKPRIG